MNTTTNTVPGRRGTRLLRYQVQGVDRVEGWVHLSASARLDLARQDADKLARQGHAVRLVDTATDAVL